MKSAIQINVCLSSKMKIGTCFPFVPLWTFISVKMKELALIRQATKPINTSLQKMQI